MRDFPLSITARLGRLVARRPSLRIRIVGGLALFAAGVLVGLPELYAAALAALPWVLLA